MNRLRAFVAVVVMMLLGPACHRGPPPAIYPGELLDPASVPGDFVIRQHIQGTYGPRKISFDAVVQKKDDTLLVLALTPYGSRAMAIQLTGRQVSVEKFIPRDLPFDPRFILLDVQRTFLMGLPDAPYADGWHRDKTADEVIRERWHDGRLHERRYTRRDHNPSGAVVVRYAGRYRAGTAPPVVTLVNEWYGYTLRLETGDFQVL